jgi:hypothetical protein
MSPNVRRQPATGEREIGQIVQRSAARGGLIFLSVAQFVERAGDGGGVDLVFRTRA